MSLPGLRIHENRCSDTKRVDQGEQHQCEGCRNNQFNGASSLCDVRKVQGLCDEMNGETWQSRRRREKSFDEVLRKSI